MTTPSLVFLRDGREAFRLPLPNNPCSVGRDPACDIRLPDPGRRLSRVHCELRPRDGLLLVVDRSANGTFVGDERLVHGRPKTLARGQSLRLAGWEVRVEAAGRDALRPISDESTVGADIAPRRSGEFGVPGEAGPICFRGMVATSDVMHRLFLDLQRLAPFDVPVLVLGETGSGKELVARALHDLSARARKPYIAVNCGAIHAETADSRLFGHEKGAFTGAIGRSVGAFREADGGSIFLDELGELPQSHQVKLLRVLERREVVPLGSSTPEPVDFRLIAATHQDLRGAVGDGSFREDLFFRLDVAVLRIPPLRERRDDILVLARAFLAQLAVSSVPMLTEAAEDALLAHSWPGNVRELRNTILRALLSTDGHVVTVADLALRAPIPLRESRFQPGPLMAADGPGSALATVHADAISLDAVERAQIMRALSRCRGNRKHAAEILGIARSTFYARLRRLGME